MLQEKGRVAMPVDVSSWRYTLFQDGLQDGLIEAPVDGGIAIRANQLPGFDGDPADRMIAATALEGHTLGISDRRILAWPGRLNPGT